MCNLKITCTLHFAHSPRCHLSPGKSLWQHSLCAHVKFEGSHCTSAQLATLAASMLPVVALQLAFPSLSLSLSRSCTAACFVLYNATHSEAQINLTLF